jgi:selenocysteine-specific elongation factor
MRYVIVGTAGHIDHGKSALVKALTGTDPDRWEEEKRRGITIDLGFAHLELGDGIRAGFIDVPGHERFVRNMLAGAGGIDVVLLVVAADESIKPQTREHFEICRFLGISKGCIVITKCDLVERDILDLVKLEVQELVAGSFLEGAPVVATSVRTGEGLETLKGELRRLAESVTSKPADRPFRLPIDRAFVMKGHGTVVTGTLIAGCVKKDAEVELHPLGRRLRVRGLEVHNQSVEMAVAGQRTALNLAGIEAREVARGMALSEPGMFRPADRLDCSLALLGTARPLKHRARVHFHCWSAETVAEVVLLEGKELKPGGQGYAQLRLASPGLFLPGDRFIIRQFSPVTTMGGGTILDIQPPRHRSGDPEVRRALETLERGDAEARLILLLREYAEASPAQLVARTGWAPAEVLRVAKLLEASQRLLAVGQPPALFAQIDYYHRLQQGVLRVLDAFHHSEPLLPGLPREDLRARVAAELRLQDNQPSPLVFSAALQDLARQGKVETSGELVAIPGRAAQLNAEEAAAREQISAAFERAGLAVPDANEVLAGLRLERTRAQRILQMLVREGVLVKVTEGLIFHRSALQKLRDLLARRKASSDRIDVGTFKEMTGLSRKYAIPLLEYLDRERITRRQGDIRIIL